MEIVAAWHLLVSCFRLGTQGLDVLGEVHKLEGVLYSKGGSEPQMKTTLQAFNGIFFSTLVRHQASMESISMRKGKVSNPRKYFKSLMIWG